MQPELTQMSLPFHREVTELAAIAAEVYKEPKLVLIVTDTRQHGHYLLQRLGNATLWTEEVKLHRELIEFDNGGKIIVVAMSDPARLAGLHPDEIVLFGQLGEFYYWMLSKGAKIRGVA